MMRISSPAIGARWPRCCSDRPPITQESPAIKARNLRRLLNIYAPLRGAGIRIEETADDYSYARVALRLRWYNRDYIVWGKAAEIDFVAPGRGHVTAEMRLDGARIESLRAATADGNRHLEWFETDIRASDGSTVARVRKQLYVRRKPHGAAATEGSRTE